MRVNKTQSGRDRLAAAAWASWPPGKAYLDVRQALKTWASTTSWRKAIGLRVFKVGMVWPLEPEACTNSRKV